MMTPPEDQVHAHEQSEVQLPSSHAHIAGPQNFSVAIARPYLNPSDVADIPGLLYFPGFLTPNEQTILFETIYRHPFLTHIHRRQQMYGEIYYHTTHNLAPIQPTMNTGESKSTTHTHGLGQPNETSSHPNPSSTLHTSSPQPLPIESLQWLIDKFFQPPFQDHGVFNINKSNYPTQILVNEYKGNQGIASHFDDVQAFDDVIATISLVSPIWMTLKKPKHLKNHCPTILEEARVFLEPGSLFVMKDDVRYRWRHGIGKYKWMDDPREGGKQGSDVEASRIYRGKDYLRLSLTIRKLLPGRKRVTSSDSQWRDNHSELCDC